MRPRTGDRPCRGVEVAREHARERMARLRADLGELLAGMGEVTLEIGCGHGHFLTAYAAERPDEVCLGVDMLGRRVRLARDKQEKRELMNLHFLRAEGSEVLACLPEGTRVARTFVLFPDPWPKKRHHKNRLMQGEFLRLLAGRTVPTGCLHFRTDHGEYFAWAEAAVKAHADWELDAEAPWPFEAPSIFQMRMGAHQSFSARRVAERPGGDEAAAI